MLPSKYKIAFAYWIGYIIFIGIYCYQTNIDTYRNSTMMKAKVVDQLIGTGRRRNYTYPQLVFMYNDSQYYFADRAAYARNLNIGENTTIIFPNKQPGNAIIYSMLPYWVSFPVVTVSFLVSLFVFMIPIFISQYMDFRKKYRH